MRISSATAASPPLVYRVVALEMMSERSLEATIRLNFSDSVSGFTTVNSRFTPVRVASSFHSAQSLPISSVIFSTLGLTPIHMVTVTGSSVRAGQHCPGGWRAKRWERRRLHWMLPVRMLLLPVPAPKALCLRRAGLLMPEMLLPGALRTRLTAAGGKQRSQHTKRQKHGRLTSFSFAYLLCFRIERMTGPFPFSIRIFGVRNKSQKLSISIKK